MDTSTPLYIYVPITFLTWRGRVHAIVYLCSNEFVNLAWTRPCQQWHGRVHAKLKNSFEHKYTMAWTRPRQVKKVIGT